MSAAVAPASDRLELQQPTNRLMLKKAEDSRRSKSMIVQQRKTQTNFRKPTFTRQPKLKIKQDAPVQAVYGQAQNFIRNFDSEIVRCKRFNQVKTYRKYEVIMRDMQLEIIKLKEKLQMEEQMKSPTKEYLNDILNKLVDYRNQNEQLRGELEHANAVIKSQRAEIQGQKHAIIRLEGNLKGKIDRLPAIEPTIHKGEMSMQDSIREFLNTKALINKQYSLPHSRLETFLQKQWQKVWAWDIPRLLSQIDKVVQNVPQTMKVDMWKIRLGLSKRMTSIMDSSTSNRNNSSMSNLNDLQTHRTEITNEERKPHWSIHQRSYKK